MLRPMARRLDERWRETKGARFEFDGQIVHQLFRRTIGPGTLIDVEFIAAHHSAVRGLQLDARGAKLALDEHGIEDESVRLWADRSN